MKLFFLVLLTSFLFFSCQNKSAISSDFNCATSDFKNLEKVNDVKSLFSMDLPKNWKINLYQDKIQSSIFAADTTKQLTETVLIDVTFIENNINFNDDFLLKQEQESLSKNLIKTRTKQITLLNKPAIYLMYKGKKGAFNYQTCHIFIKLNEQNFIFAKTEIYGDSLVNQKFCKSFSLIESIKTHQ
jgi:hypothetical protein